MYRRDDRLDRSNWQFHFRRENPACPASSPVRGDIFVEPVQKRISELRQKRHLLVAKDICPNEQPTRLCRP